MNINKLLHIVNINKDLLNESFFSELPKNYIRSFIRLSISGETGKNNGIKDALDDFFAGCKLYYLHSLQANKINNIMTENYFYKKFIYFCNHSGMSKVFTIKNFRNRVYFTKQIDNYFNNSNLPPYNSDTYEKLKNMNSFEFSIIPSSDNIHSGARYLPNTDSISEVHIYFSLKDVNDLIMNELKKGTKKQKIYNIIEDHFKQLKNDCISKISLSMYHELIHHIQNTSSKEYNKKHVKEYNKSLDKFDKNSPKQIKFKTFVKNLKINDVFKISTKLELRTYTDTFLKEFKQLYTKKRKNKISAQKYSYMFVKLIEDLLNQIYDVVYDYFSSFTLLDDQDNIIDLKNNSIEKYMIKITEKIFNAFLSVTKNDKVQNNNIPSILIKQLYALSQMFPSKSRKIILNSVKKYDTSLTLKESNRDKFLDLIQRKGYVSPATDEELEQDANVFYDILGGIDVPRVKLDPNVIGYARSDQTGKPVIIMVNLPVGEYVYYNGEKLKIYDNINVFKRTYVDEFKQYKRKRKIKLQYKNQDIPAYIIGILFPRI